MKFQVSRDTFVDAVAWTSRCLPNRTTNPLLTGLHLVADKNSLSVSGQDLDQSARITIEAEVITAGETLVPGKLLTEIVKSLPSAPVQLEIDGSRATITSGRASFTLPVLPVADYPTLPAMPASSGTVGGHEFAAAVSAVATAASKDDTLPAFTGIKIDIEGSTAVLAATDRYRLAVYEFPWAASSPALSVHALIPAKFLTDSAKALGGSKSVSLALAAAADGLVGIEGDGRQSTSRVIAADFPKYQSLLPGEPTTIARVNCADLIDAVRRVALVLSRESPVRITFDDKGAEISGLGSDTGGEAHDLVDCEVTGEAISIAFNPHFLVEGLAALNSPYAVVAMTQPGKPALFSGAAAADAPANESFRYLLMPIRN